MEDKTAGVCALCYDQGTEVAICLRCGFCDGCSGCGVGCGEDCGGVSDASAIRRVAHDFVAVPKWEQDALATVNREVARYYRCVECDQVTDMPVYSELLPNPNIIFQGEIAPELVDLPGGTYEAFYEPGDVQLLESEYLRRVEGADAFGTEVFGGYIRRCHSVPQVRYEIFSADDSLVSR